MSDYQDVLKSLYECSLPISESSVNLSPYTFNAHRLGLSNYRLLTLGNLITSSFLQENLTGKYINFLKEAGQVLIVFNVITGNPFSAVFINLSNRSKLFYGSSSGLFYNLGNLRSEFKYGDPVCLVEGTLDCDALTEVFPDTLALLTSSFSNFQLEVLHLLTDSVYLLYDNPAVDKTAAKNLPRDFSRLSSKGIKAKIISYPGSIKDPGVLVENLFYGREDLYRTNIKFFSAQLNSYK